VTITIVLADDHPVVRAGVRNLLEAESDMRVVGEIHEALRVESEIERMRPDVLVLDVFMPDLNGMEVARRVTKRTPGTRIVILSMHSNEAYVVEALRSGALGYVLKGASPQALVEGIRTVHTGRRYLSPPLAADVIEAYLTRAGGAPLDEYETLTSREREVLHLVAQGNTSAEIATRLFISPRTVETHRANIMRKLELHSQGDVVRYALRRGIIEPLA
jgi:two-component system response regulator NreC